MKREKLIDFARGTLSEPLRARFLHEGIATPMDVTAVGNGILMLGHPELAHPKKHQALVRSLEKATQDGANWEFSLQFNGARYSQRSATAAYLRIGYLAAFAAFGYSYAFHPGLRQTARRHLLHPEERVLQVFSMTSSDDKKETRRMLIVQEPKEMQSLVVSFGRHLVYLPWPPSHTAIYDYLAIQDTSKLQSLKLRGKLLKWPYEPLHLMDQGRLVAEAKEHHV